MICSENNTPKCETCKTAPIRKKNERFCKDCRKALLAHLREVGYLDRGYMNPGPLREHRATSYEEKEWNGGWDNAVRALEE